jgi:hypothetical protein
LRKLGIAIMRRTSTCLVIGVVTFAIACSEKPVEEKISAKAEVKVPAKGKVVDPLSIAVKLQIQALSTNCLAAIRSDLTGVVEAHPVLAGIGDAKIVLESPDWARTDAFLQAWFDFSKPGMYFWVGITDAFFYKHPVTGSWDLEFGCGRRGHLSRSDSD